MTTKRNLLERTALAVGVSGALMLGAAVVQADPFVFDPRALPTDTIEAGDTSNTGTNAAYEDFLTSTLGAAADGFGGAPTATADELIWRARNVASSSAVNWGIFTTSADADKTTVEVGDSFSEAFNMILDHSNTIQGGGAGNVKRTYLTDFLAGNPADSFVFMRIRASGKIAAGTGSGTTGTLHNLAYDSVDFEVCYDRSGTASGTGGGDGGVTNEGAAYNCDISLLSASGTGTGDFNDNVGTPAQGTLNWVATVSAATPGAFKDVTSGTDYSSLSTTTQIFKFTTSGVQGSDPFGSTPVCGGFTDNFGAAADCVQTIQGRTVSQTTTFGIPEPGSLALLGIGLLGIGAVSRRRRAT